MKPTGSQDSMAPPLPMMDMCLYKEDGTVVYPPEDLESDRMKSREDDDGEWRLVTVIWDHVFNKEYAGENENRLVKGYGRVTVLKNYPEQFYEFAFWYVPEDEDMQPCWEVRDVHWEHTWQDFYEDE